MRTLPDASIDAIITDPPYAEVDREYGRLSEPEWHILMRAIVEESRRVLKPRGSAVFILQPNSEKVGRMRPWLWEFLAWTAREWNQVQDEYWWNPTTLPNVHSIKGGLPRTSVKHSVWLGAPDCVRFQDRVLWEASDATKAAQVVERAAKGRERRPSGHSMKADTVYDASIRRGGVTPFNLLPIATDGIGGQLGHGAATPLALADWWTRYIVPEGGTVLDPFMGSGTMGVAALRHGHDFVGFERFDKYFETASARLHDERERIAA